MKTRPLALIIGIVLASQHAVAIDTPPGWERKSMPSGAIYSPKNEEGREIGIEIADLVTGQGSPAQVLNLFADAIGSNMTIVQRGEIKAKTFSPISPPTPLVTTKCASLISRRKKMPNFCSATKKP